MTEEVDAREQSSGLKNWVTEIIRNVLKDNEYGFEVYVVMKTEPKLRSFCLVEGRVEDRHNPEKNFKLKVQLSIAKTVIEKFLDTEKEYETAEYVADRQDKFYVIPQDDLYKPFDMINPLPANVEGYRANERENVRGILFRFEREERVVWAYQMLYENAIPNRKGNGFHIIPSDGDMFEELKKPLLLLAPRVDLLIVDHEIICDRIDFLQRYFEFQTYVNLTAAKVVDRIGSMDLVVSVDKAIEYIGRSKLSYARKMMRIKDSKVLEKNAADLFQKITTLPRWQGKFEFDSNSGKIVLNTFEQVENLIDLLDERFTRSDVTDEEYDSGAGAKKWVAPVI